MPRHLVPCTLYPSTVLRLFQIVPPRPLEPGASFSLELTGSHGAALVTKYQTYREDCESVSTFKSYTERHYESWVTFARNGGHGNDVRPVLVSGFDMTGDFAMVAYSNEDPSLEPDLIVDAPTPGPTSVWGTWRTRRSCHTNHGPSSPPSREQAIGLPSSQQADARSIPDGFNQSVFIRYYTVDRKTLFTTLNNAGVGSHDPGPWHNEGDDFTESTLRSDDEDSKGWLAHHG